MSYEDKAIVSEWMDHLKNLNVKVKKEQFRINVIHFTESYEKYVGFHFYTSNSKNIVN